MTLESDDITSTVTVNDIVINHRDHRLDSVTTRKGDYCIGVKADRITNGPRSRICLLPETALGMKLCC